MAVINRLGKAEDEAAALPSAAHVLAGDPE